MKSTTFIIIAFFVSLALLIALFYLIWINRGTDRTISIVCKLVVPPLGIAFVVVMYEMLGVPLPNKKVTIPVLLVHNQYYKTVPMHRILRNASNKCVYVIMGFITDEWAKNNQEAIKKGEVQPHPLRYYEDLLEMALVNWLGLKYSSHWRVERTWFEGIGIAGGFTTGADDVEKSCFDLTRLLQGNFIVQNSIGALFLADRLCLPSKSKIRISRSRDGKPTRLTIDNGNIKLVVAIDYLGGGTVMGGKIQDKIKEVFQEGKLSQKALNVTFTLEVKRWKRWSSLTEQQIQWIDELITLFQEDFDWRVFSKDLQQQVE